MKRVVLVFLAACAHDPPPPPVAASSDLVVPPMGAAARAGTTCRRILTAGKIEKSSPTCYLDQNIEQGGVLDYPCSGDGIASAELRGGTRYDGTMKAGRLRLTATTELEWDEDGCRWGTTGTILGTTEKLEWRYEDHVIRGDKCSATCTASASFDVHD